MTKITHYCNSHNNKFTVMYYCLRRSKIYVVSYFHMCIEWIKILNFVFLNILCSKIGVADFSFSFTDIKK